MPSLPLFFEENRGQTDPSVRFINRGGNSTTFFRDSDVVMQLPASADAGTAVVQMRFLDAHQDVAVEGGGEQSSKSAYFRGADPERWIRNAAHFATLTYDDVYPGIDIVFSGHEGELRYDFHIAPNIDPHQIRLAFTGIKGAELAENGDLILDTPADEIVHMAPIVYQDIDGARVFVDGAFEISDQQEVSFALADYDRSQPLVIDPVISYSTFLGGTGFDSGRSVRVDPVDRTIVVTGRTDSLDFPLAGPTQSVIGGGVNPTGWAPNPNSTDAVFLWDKSFGRTDTYSVKITTSSRLVPLSNPGWRTVNAIPINQTSTYTASVWVNSPDGGVGHIPAIQFFDSGDNFLGTIGAIGPSGFPPLPQLPPDTWVQQSFTFTPSSFPTFATATQVRVIVVQDIETTRPAPTTVFFDDVVLEDNAFPGNLLFQISSFNISPSDVFVTKLAADGASLIFSTYLGGFNGEFPQNVELDSLGNIIVGGRTSSTDFPIANAAQPVFGGGFEDGFLTKLPPDGSSLIYSTYVGGNDLFFAPEEIRGILIDAADNALVIGNTGASNFQTTHLINATPCVATGLPQDSDIFVRQYSPAGAIMMSTCFGGTGRDAGRNIGFDSSGNLFATGWTRSADFPVTPGAAQSVFGDGPNSPFSSDGWVSKLNPGATSILASTYLGGFGDEFLEGLGVDGFDSVVVSGATNAADYPTTPGAFQTTYGGSAVVGGTGDGVITKLNPTLTGLTFSTYLGGSGDDFAWGLKLDVEDRVYLTGSTSSPNFPTFDPIQGALSGPSDAFVTQMTATGDALDFSTYLGGSGGENASNGITVLNPGNVFVTGSTGSADYPLLNSFQASLAGVSDAFVTNISTPITVPAEDCTDTVLGCNPTGGQQIILPDNFVVPAGATITQTAVPEVDTRVVNGRCDGLTPLSLFDGDLIIPGHLCGGDDGFTVLVTETTNIDIRDGTVLSIGFPEVFSPDALVCERPIVADRQLQDVMVWQTTDKADLFEGRAIEVTHDCGTSRTRTRTLSFFVIGLFIDFGLGPNPMPDAVTQAFVNMLLDKTDALIEATADAEPVLKKGDLNKLRVKVRDIRARLEVGDYLEALNKTNIFLSFLDKAVFDTTDPFNHEGNLIMRAGNIKFILEVKVIPFTP